MARLPTISTITRSVTRTYWARGAVAIRGDTIVDLGTEFPPLKIIIFDK